MAPPQNKRIFVQDIFLELSNRQASTDASLFL